MHPPGRGLSPRVRAGTRTRASTGHGVKKADRLKLSLYFEPSVRGQQIIATDMKVKGQEEALKAMLEAGEEVPDEDVLDREYGFFNVELSEDKKIKGYQLIKKKYDEAVLTAAFFAIMTIKLDMTPTQAMDSYKLRDEHLGTCSSFITTLQHELFISFY